MKFPNSPRINKLLVFHNSQIRYLNKELYNSRQLSILGNDSDKKYLDLLIDLRSEETIILNILLNYVKLINDVPRIRSNNRTSFV